MLRVNNDHDDNPWLVVLFHRLYTLFSIAKPGDKSWKEISVPRKKGSLKCGMLDVTYCSEMHSLLFVDVEGDLHSYDVRDTKQPQLLKTYYVKGPPGLFTPSHPLFRYATFTYIVRCNDSLLILERVRICMVGSQSSHSDDKKTRFFSVFKLLDPLTCKWEQLHDLNGATLFVGNNTTVSISASHSGLRSNCIYFNDDYRSSYEANTDRLGGRDLGVYDMAERSCEHILNNEDNTKSSYSCPFWFSPSL